MIENKSTNTGENILFTKKLLEEAGMRPQKIIAVQKPYMERRTYATFKKMWPELEVMVTSPQILFEDYPTTDIPKEEIINDIVGDLCRIKLYPEKRYSIPQDIPTDVWQVYEQLVSAGFTKYLLTNP